MELTNTTSDAFYCLFDFTISTQPVPSVLTIKILPSPQTTKFDSNRTNLEHFCVNWQIIVFSPESIFTDKTRFPLTTKQVLSSKKALASTPLSKKSF